jgi:hypothetical protein
MPSRSAWRGFTPLALVATSILVAVACSSEGAPPDGGPGHAGDAGSAGSPSGGSAGRGGSAGSATGGSSGSPAGGAPDDGGAGGGGEGGRADMELDLERLVRSGGVATTTEPRSSFGALLVANDGERVYAVESRRDVEPGPLGLPWRSRFRLAAYDAGVETWAFAAEPDDVVSDVAVHPSGDVTVAVLRQAPERRAFELLRFTRDGARLGTTALEEPTTPPDTDYGAAGRPLFRMKSPLADATDGGWVRLVAEGEGLVAAILSYVDRPSTDPLSVRFVLGLERLDWENGRYAERWARVVEGPHGASPASWAYDELRWREQAIRPFLARDALTGELLVGRAWNNTRCQANLAVFAEFTAQECVFGSVGAVENERLPLAVTRFGAGGERLGTIVLAPDEDAAEQLAFTLAARGGKLAVAGAVVRTLADGSKRTYPDPDGYVDYDGYVAVYDAAGALELSRDFNAGRGDVLAALRWTTQGIVAVGSAGWDRWQGGMSISRGADPLVAFLSTDGARSVTRVVPMSDGARHYNLHDVTLLGRSLVAHGFSDAPMTHSSDGGNDAARTFGALRVELGEP